MVKYGVEIECCANTDIVKVDKDGYHGRNSVLLADNYWKSESDGSLRAGDFTHSDSFEFISKTCKDEEELSKALVAFEAYFSDGGKYELNEVLSFNNSTGCHIHFSFDNKKFLFRKLATFNSFMALRNYFLTAIERSSINDIAKNEIKKRYFRSYASKLTKAGFNNALGDRRKEFNFCSEDNGTGLEWRSINLTGIKTWAEFKEIFAIIIKSINFFKDNRSKFADKRKGIIEKSLYMTFMDNELVEVPLDIRIKKDLSVNEVVVNKNEGILGRDEIINIEGLGFE